MRHLLVLPAVYSSVESPTLMSTGKASTLILAAHGATQRAATAATAALREEQADLLANTLVAESLERNESLRCHALERALATAAHDPAAAWVTYTKVVRNTADEARSRLEAATGASPATVELMSKYVESLTKMCEVCGSRRHSPEHLRGRCTELTRRSSRPLRSLRAPRPPSTAGSSRGHRTPCLILRVCRRAVWSQRLAIRSAARVRVRIVRKPRPPSAAPACLG